MVWTGIAVLASAIVTLSPQAIRLLHDGTTGNEATRLLLNLLVVHTVYALASLSWLAWRGCVRDGWRIRLRYGFHTYRLPRQSWRWYLAAIAVTLVSVGAQQLAVTALARQGRPLSIAVLVGKTMPFWLTLWDVRRSRWFPVIGAAQFVATAVAMEFLLIGGPFGIAINLSMTATFPIIALLFLWSWGSAGLRWLDRKVFQEEQDLLAGHMSTGTTTQEDASFLTAKLLTVIQLSLSALYAAGFVITGMLWGFPVWHGWGPLAAIALFLACGFANSMLVASAIHGRMALYGTASASTLGLAYLWNGLFQGLPFTSEQLWGSLVVVLGVPAAAWVEKRAKRKETSAEDAQDPPG